MKQIMNRLKLNTKNPTWLEYIFPIGIWLLGMLIYSYIDFQSLTIWSTTLLDCLVDGNLYDYYEIVHQNIHNAPHENFCYNYIILIPWAIWNIPIWLIQRFLHVEILDSTLMQFWSHLFLIFVFFIVVYYSKKIVRIFVEDEEYVAWNSYLLMTFPAIFIGVILAGQTDIIAIAITVAAVYYLLNGKQKLFLLLMAISIAAKPFFIFAYIAVILLIEKNIIKIALKLLSSVSFMFIFQLIYANAPMYLESYNAGSGNSIIESTITSAIMANITFRYRAPLVIILLVVIYFVAYCINYENTKEKNYYVIYMMVAPMMAYFCFAYYDFYRLIYLAPFMIILMTINPGIYRLNVIIQKIISALGVFLVIYCKWSAAPLFFNQITMKHLGLYRDTEKFIYPSLFDLLVAKFENLSMIQNIGAAVFITLSGIFLVINIPIISKKIKQPIVKCERWIYWIDTFVLYGMMGIMILCYFNMIP